MVQGISPRDAEVADLTIEEIAQRYTARFLDRKADWGAFADASVDAYRRADYRFIGDRLGTHQLAGSNEHQDPDTIPARGFTLSLMFVEPGQANAAHTHEVEELFFVLKGQLTAFFEDETGRRVDVKLGPWDCICCPPGVVHGYVNEGLEPVYFQVMLGKGHPELMGYVDPDLLRERDVHLRESKP